jgi:hypothetical protein
LKIGFLFLRIGGHGAEGIDGIQPGFGTPQAGAEEACAVADPTSYFNDDSVLRQIVRQLIEKGLLLRGGERFSLKSFGDIDEVGPIDFGAPFGQGFEIAIELSGAALISEKRADHLNPDISRVFMGAGRRDIF